MYDISDEFCVTLKIMIQKEFKGSWGERELEKLQRMMWISHSRLLRSTDILENALIDVAGNFSHIYTLYISSKCWPMYL